MAKIILEAKITVFPEYYCIGCGVMATSKVTMPNSYYHTVAGLRKAVTEHSKAKVENMPIGWSSELDGDNTRIYECPKCSKNLR